MTEDNEDIGQRLENGVSDIHPRQRLSEIQAQKRCPYKRVGAVLAVAAAVVAMVVVLNVKHDGDQGQILRAGTGVTGTPAEVSSPDSSASTQSVTKSSPPKTDPGLEPVGPSAPKDNVPPTDSVPPPNYDYGLFAHDTLDAELAKNLQATNGYGGTYQESYYYIVAGSDVADSPNGELFISQTSATTDSGSPKFSTHTLEGHGTLTILSAVLPQVSLQAADGSTHTFNLETGAFD